VDFRQFQQKIQAALCQSLPGRTAQQKLSVQPFRSLPHEKTTRKRDASVLLLLFQENDDLKFILTKRTKTMTNHGGQISFPGGALDSGESTEAAALREAKEEIGLLPNDINILGSLSPLFVPVSGFTIFPLVGWMDKRPQILPNPTEVEKIILVSIQDLQSEQNVRKETSEWQGIDFTIPYFALNGEKVWGATAMILSEFRQILRIL